MKHAGTDMQVFAEVLAFAKALGMIPLPLYKEQRGYILNSLLAPFLEAAELLLLNEVADIETIDRTWMAATGSPLGPFAILDIVGLNTAYNITLAKAKATGNPKLENLVKLLKKEYIDKGKLGKATGEGFYTYPNPSYIQPEFLKG